MRVAGRDGTKLFGESASSWTFSPLTCYMFSSGLRIGRHIVLTHVFVFLVWC